MMKSSVSCECSLPLRPSRLAGDLSEWFAVKQKTGILFSKRAILALKQPKNGAKLTPSVY
jgi:hypothetical protein